MPSVSTPGQRETTIFADEKKPIFRPPSAPQGLLRELLALSLILTEDWEQLPLGKRQELQRCGDQETLFTKLIETGLLNDYQAARIQAGRAFGLLLGNYRVVDRLGAGGMGVVFKAEHIFLRRLVAIKVVPLAAEVVPLYPDQDAALRHRFYTEMRTIAQLQHPNIVSVFDAGTATSTDAEEPVLHYFAMEYVPGIDLEHFVKSHGPLPVVQACDLMHQIASALMETDRHKLIHRDIKPSNILVTSEGQAKLLDFGLARHFDHSRLTEPGSILGTVDYMAPEQVRDASTVDIRADIYALGGTLFWCLTGQKPFPSQGNAVVDLTNRLNQEPPSLHKLAPEVPPELEQVVRKMMALQPDDRYASPQEVCQALLPFLQEESAEDLLEPLPHTNGKAVPVVHLKHTSEPRVQRVLIVDDETDLRQFCRLVLESDHLKCDEAGDGFAALQAIEAQTYDLVLLDINMPRLSGLEVCTQLRRDGVTPHQKILLFSGHLGVDDMAQMLLAGADDCITKPFSMVQLRSRVQALLRLKEAQDRSDSLNSHLHRLNEKLEKHLQATSADLLHVRNGLVLALARVVEYRENQSGHHLLRLQRYCRVLAEEAAQLPVFAERIDTAFVQMLECCAPLHDIGKMGVPDHILLKPGKLDGEERMLMQAHTTIGADALQAVAAQNGSALGFLQMAIAIARHHHERHDGRGYPDGLSGDAIPLAAQIVHVGDVYDGLRCRRSYKPAISHATAVQVMSEGSAGQFHPDLLQAFQKCAPAFEQIFRELAE